MKFVNPVNVVAQMGLKHGYTVADLGSGGGFFAVAAAKFVGQQGIVYAVDVQEAKLVATASAASIQKFKNIKILKADLEKPLTEINETSCDAVIMASILHEVKNRQYLLDNAYRLLKTGGRLLAVEWKNEASPFGPAMEKRISQEKLESEILKMGMRKLKSIPADLYHYAVVFEK